MEGDTGEQEFISKKRIVEKDITQESKPKSELLMKAMASIELENCPICFELKIFDLEKICHQCGVTICATCFNQLEKKTLCPLCNEATLRDLGFFEKKVIKSTSVICPNCQQMFKVEDKYTVPKHKIGCYLPNLTVKTVKGDVDSMVNCLIQNKENLIKILNERSDPATLIADIRKETGDRWNLAFGDFIYTFHWRNGLVMDYNSKDLIFFN